MSLEVEKARDDELLPNLLPENEGKFAVIVGRDLIGIFETNDEAWMAGYHRVGMNPFLLRRFTDGKRFVTLLGLQSAPMEKLAAV